MNSEEILALMAEAELPPVMLHPIVIDKLENFANLIEAKVVEECAVICDAEQIYDGSSWDGGVKKCASAIRAKGELK